MTAERESTDGGGLSRRQLVRRGAIAGGLVWAAPVIRTTAAYATTANGTEKPCENFFMVVINPAGHALPPPAQTQGREVPPAIRRWFLDNPGVTVQVPSVAPQLTAVSDEEAAVLLPEVTGPNAAGRQCRMVLGFARKGAKDFSEAFVDPDPPIAVAVGRRLIFPCPRSADGDGDTDGDHNSITAQSATAASTSTTSAPATGTDPTAVGSASLAPASSTLGADGASGGGLASDGTGGPTLGADGRPSTSGGNNGGGNNGGGHDDGDNDGDDQNHGPGHCFDALYLIYCCPR